MPYSDKKKQREAQRKYDAKRKGTRHHNWNAIGYPESLPENWRDILNEMMVQWWASPLHNLDKNPDGTQKKDHYHIDISFHSPVTYEQAKRLFDAIGAVMPPKNPAPGQAQPDVLDLKQSLRYFCHIDNPSKAQYSPRDATYGGGATPYIDMIASASDDEQILCDVQDFCDQYQIKSYKRLCQYVRKNKPEWKRVVLRTCSVAITRYLRSAEYEVTNPMVAMDRLGEVDPELEMVLCDFATGEVVDVADTIESRKDFEERAETSAELKAGNAMMAILEAQAKAMREG